MLGCEYYFLHSNVHVCDFCFRFSVFLPAKVFIFCGLVCRKRMMRTSLLLAVRVRVFYSTVLLNFGQERAF